MRSDKVGQCCIEREDISALDPADSDGVTTAGGMPNRAQQSWLAVRKRVRVSSMMTSCGFGAFVQDEMFNNGCIDMLIFCLQGSFVCEVEERNGE